MPGSFLKLLKELWPEYKPRIPSTIFSLHCADSLQRWDNALRNIVNGCFDTSLHRIFSQLNISWQGSGSLECFVNLKSNMREVLFMGGSQCGRTRGMGGALCWESPLLILNGTAHSESSSWVWPAHLSKYWSWHSPTIFQHEPVVLVAGALRYLHVTEGLEEICHSLSSGPPACSWSILSIPLDNIWHMLLPEHATLSIRKVILVFLAGKYENLLHWLLYQLLTWEQGLWENVSVRLAHRQVFQALFCLINDNLLCLPSSGQMIQNCI